MGCAWNLKEVPDTMEAPDWEEKFKNMQEHQDIFAGKSVSNKDSIEIVTGLKSKSENF